MMFPNLAFRVDEGSDIIAVAAGRAVVVNDHTAFGARLVAIRAVFGAWTQEVTVVLRKR